MSERDSRPSCLLHAVGSRAPLDYLLSGDELQRFGYPTERDLQRGYRRLGVAAGQTAPALAENLPPGSQPGIFGLDCEMVLTRDGPAVARVSLVEWLGFQQSPPFRVVLDRMIRPGAEVIDHLTAITGMDAAALAAADATREEIRDELCRHVRPGDILCGHSVDNDLHALALVHERVLDTAAIYARHERPHLDGPLARRSLADLAGDHLSRRIQQKSHSSIEDAGAALELAMKRIASGAGRLRWTALPDREPGVLTRLDLDTALERLGFQPEQVRCAYLRGSRAVGVAGRRDDGTLSDWDLVLVTEIPGTTQDDIHLSSGNIDAAIYDVDAFRRLIRRCSIWALECIFAPASCIWKQDIDFRAEFAAASAELSRGLFLARLRRSVSYHASRQWRRARQYLEQRGDRYACRKRMFIAIRFVMYGLEVARTGRIDDLGCINDLWNHRMAGDPAATWAELAGAYGPIYRDRSREFRQLTEVAPRYGGFHQRREHLPAGRPRSPIGRPSTSPSIRSNGREARDPRAASSTRHDRDRDAMATVEFLRTRGAGPEEALANLQRQYRIGVCHHGQFPGVVQLRYTQRSRPVDHPIVRQCRGLILDAANDFAVLAYPFDRFFDSRDPAARIAELDWSTARVHDKLDGSLAILYWYRDRWNVASSRRPDGSGAMCQRAPGGAISFETLFWTIWDRLGLAVPPPPGPGFRRRCYLFELTSWRHPIVVRYPDEALTLIGVRDLDSLCELDPGPVAEDHGWPCVTSRSLPASVAESVEPGDELLTGGPGRVAPAALERRLRRAAAALDGSVAEGFVVCDARFHRVKVKSPDYIRKAWMFPLCPGRAAINPRRLLELVIAGAGPEFALYNPAYGPEVEELQRVYDRFCSEVEAVYDALEPIEDQKEFARRALERVYANLLFRMRKCGGTVQEHLAITGIRNVETYLQSMT